MYHGRNKDASVSASTEALNNLGMPFRKNIKDHKYYVIGGYENYSVDLEAVMAQYEATQGLGVEVI